MGSRADEDSVRIALGSREFSPAGLSTDQAARRLTETGFNELPTKTRRTTFRIVLEVARDPMFVLLFMAGGIYVILGDPQDAAMLLGFVCITVAITAVQERKTERILETLRDLSSPRALVVRNGTRVRIPGREVVIGDLLVLAEGDRIAADGVLLDSPDLLIDESLLTGESIAVSKVSAPLVNPSCLAASVSAASIVYSGTLVLQGSGLALVTATGTLTELGKIGKSAESLLPEKSRLQQEIAILIKRFSFLAIAVSIVVAALYAWLRGDLTAGFLAGITLAMSTLPEEFTVVLTVFMALGAWRISKSQVLTRHTPVIEALGAATVLCVDKTGTLTQNRMTMHSVATESEIISIRSLSPADVPAEVIAILRYAVLASEVSPFDPMEKAFHRQFEEFSAADYQAIHSWSLVCDYPLSAEWIAMTHVWRRPGSTLQIVASKGAPESVARLCKLKPDHIQRILQQVEKLASSGLRVLAVASATYAKPEWPSMPDAFDFTWLGLVGLSDPIRPEVPDSVRECQRAGIRVVMITGDYPATARAIARAAGLVHQAVLTGSEINAMDDHALARAIKQVSVFARIRPEQKLRLVQAFKANGEVVGMTGDGVNDVPALKAAHIGISMGERGTDVAREASSLVLLNDDFMSIVRVIRLGRRIYDNLHQALMYVAAIHIPIAGMTVIPLMVGAAPVLLPAHVVFFEMIINPACALIFEAEPEDAEIMQRPPRASDERLFSLRALLFSFSQGCGLLLAAGAAFIVALNMGIPEDRIRTIVFVILVIGNLGLIVSNRSSTATLRTLLSVPNRAQWMIVIGALSALMGILSIPALRDLFHLMPVSGVVLALAAIAAFAVILWFESVKMLFRPKTARTTVSALNLQD